RQLTQGELQTFTLHAVEADVEEAGDPLLGGPVQRYAADGAQAFPEPVPQPADAGRVDFALALSQLNRRPHTDNLVCGQRAGTQAGLLSASMDQRPQPDGRLAANIKSPYSLGPVGLVRCERQQIDVHRLDVDRQLASALRRIHVERHAALAAQTADS